MELLSIAREASRGQRGSWWGARFWAARVRHESAVASSFAVLAGRERLQAGRCFSHVPFGCGQPFDGFSGRAYGTGARSAVDETSFSGRDNIYVRYI